MDHKNSKAANTTVTYDRNRIEEPVGNIYEAIAILAKRSQQINADLKSELIEKLEEFATYTDSLDEIFENKEQIEVSKFYEKLPKPTAMAIQEWLEEKIYHRKPEEDSTE
jgi:DNA-directed RNA polymerase subunit K/omega